MFPRIHIFLHSKFMNQQWHKTIGNLIPVNYLNNTFSRKLCESSTSNYTSDLNQFKHICVNNLQF